ncbi:MAG: amidohydrolase family protein [Chloroflexota bacterium]
MTTDLTHFIWQTPLCDTHEHLGKEDDYLEKAPDILQNLFENYVSADLFVAGASQEAIDQLFDATDLDIRGRFKRVQPAWEAVQFTGYGEAVRLIARELYGIDEITADALEQAQPKNEALIQSGKRLRLLRDKANLDHVQTDDFVWECAPDPSGSDFFFYDLSWVSFCRGAPDLEALANETGITVHNLDTLDQAMEALFEKYAAFAIAIKSQHAYNRTLHWQKRSKREASLALATYLNTPDEYSPEDHLCLGDWCWARGVELGIKHDLPFKLHTGYYAGHSRMPVDYIRSGNLCPILAEYPSARFVLMHIAYPYGQELIALAKHYANVYVDLCWAWSIDPYSSLDFIRRFIHAAPANKLFVFGGDTFYPGAALAYAHQTRTWLNRTLQAEIDDGYLTEAETISLAKRFMRNNQYACFNVEQKKAFMAQS